MCRAQAFPISLSLRNVQSVQNVKLTSSAPQEPALQRTNTEPSKRSTDSNRAPLKRSMTDQSPAKQSGTFFSLSRKPLNSGGRSSSDLLEEMRHGFATLKRSSSRKLSESFSRTGSIKNLISPEDLEVQQDLNFFELIKHNPTDPEEKSRYNDTAVRKYIRRHPEALRVQYDFPVGGKAAVRRYPLMALIALDASLTTLRLAIKAHPAALEAASDFSSTALHAVCSWSANSMDVVEYIYQKYPAAIRETTKLVYLPLHNACQAVTPSLALVQFLVREYPEGLMAINKLGDTPLRTAERNPTISQEVLNFLQAETTHLFSLEKNSATFQQVVERQSWGNKELNKVVSPSA